MLQTEDGQAAAASPRRGHRGAGKPAPEIHYLVAIFNADADAARAVSSLREAPLEAARVVIDARPDPLLDEYGSRDEVADATTVGAVVGGMGGLFAGGLLTQLFSAEAAFEIALIVLFAGLGGVAVGGFVGGTVTSEGRFLRPPALEPINIRCCAVFVQSSRARDVRLAAKILRGEGAADVYGLDPDGRRLSA